MSDELLRRDGPTIGEGRDAPRPGEVDGKPSAPAAAVGGGTVPPEKPALSPSRLAMIGRCGVQYQFRYVEGIVAPPGVALIIGTATHTSIEKDLTAKRDAGALLSDEEVAANAADALKANWDGQQPVLSEKEQEIGAQPVRARAIDMSVRLAQLHHREIAPAIQPVHIERPFRLELKRYPYDLQGFIDIQEPTRVRDTKTTGKALTQADVDESVQLTTYALAGKALDGAAPASVHLDLLVKTREPYATSLSSTRGPDQFRALLDRVERAARVIDAGAFYPTDPGNWWCSKQFCGWFERCPFGARARTTVGEYASHQR